MDPISVIIQTMPLNWETSPWPRLAGMASDSTGPPLTRPLSTLSFRCRRPTGWRRLRTSRCLGTCGLWTSRAWRPPPLTESPSTGWCGTIGPQCSLLRPPQVPLTFLSLASVFPNRKLPKDNQTQLVFEQTWIPQDIALWCLIMGRNKAAQLLGHLSQCPSCEPQPFGLCNAQPGDYALSPYGRALWLHRLPPG